MKTVTIMKITRFFALALLIPLTADLRAAVPAGKTQQITSPEQVPSGLAKSDWASIRAAYEAGRHAFAPVAGGWQARNPGQQWLTRFDGRGFVAEPAGGGWQWGLELKGYGFPGEERSISGVPAVKAEGQRLTYGWDAAVEEWFVNDARGLEHGFTVRARPAAGADATAPLQFDLAVRGSLAAQVGADGLGVEFRDAAGAVMLRYGGLKVWDADGKVLAARFEPLDTRHPTLVTLSVDERGARYPITVDPLAQQAYLKASNTGAGDFFGYSVAVSADTVVVGAFNEDGSGTGVNPADNNLAGDSGAAYVFVRSGTNWSLQAHLKASNTGANDHFGASVAVSGDTVVVGAFGEDGNGTGVNPADNNLAGDSGAAYVFVRSGTSWSQQAYLKASIILGGGDFGWSVAASGDTAVVGSRYSAAVYVFVRSGTSWSQQAYLTPSNLGPGDEFGISVAVSGDTVVVGAREEDGSGTGVNPPSNELAVGAGAAYVFVRSGTSWSEQAYLKASNTGAFDEFGKFVAVSGDAVVVGANLEDGSGIGVNPASNNLAIGSGAAYVFVRSGTSWSEQAYLKASNTGSGDQFGISVGVSGDTVVVGALFESGNGTGVNPPSNELASGSGAAYVFVRSGTSWSQLRYRKASNTGADDRFGNAVAVSGDTVVVGAFLEDGSGTGVNPADNNLAGEAGAAYVFLVDSPPDADAGSGFSVNEGQLLVMLDGSASSDPEGDTLTYAWVQVSGTAVLLSNATAQQPTFTAPTVPLGGETLSFDLTVSARGLSSIDTVNVTVVNVNHPPVADAGPDQSVAEGSSPVTLHGENSFDIDTDLFTYAWVQVGGIPTVTLTGANTVMPTFTAPTVGTGGAPGVVATLVFELTVDDGYPPDVPAPGYTLANVVDSVTVEITNVNNDPTASAGADQTVNEASAVVLSGSASNDPDNDTLTYAWAQIGGPAAVGITGAATATLGFTAPFVSPGGADITFELTVDDGYGGSDTDTVVIHVQNINDPPLASAAQPTKSALWPPNHGLVAVGITGVSDPNNNATITITGVTQDEPTNGQGDGDTAIDAIINAGGTVLLRAERSGNGNGRVYHIHFTASDFEGSTSGMVKVSVPHSKKSIAIDGGELFDSTQ